MERKEEERVEKNGVEHQEKKKDKSGENLKVRNPTNKKKSYSL